MSEQQDLYLGVVRNAFILLLVGLAIFELHPAWTRPALVVLFIVLIILLALVVHYYTYGVRSSLMTLIMTGILVMAGVVTWILVDIIRTS